jgi:hypothetical protein
LTKVSCCRTCGCAISTGASSPIGTPRTRPNIGGTDILDPQYRDCPNDISPADRELYFNPIQVTDGQGALASWLVPYHPKSGKRVA